MNEAHVTALAVELLIELRGMAREELSSNEVRYVAGKMARAYGLGWLAGKGIAYAEANAAPVCEGCSDGGHFEGQ